MKILCYVFPLTLSELKKLGCKDRFFENHKPGCMG